MRLLFLAEIYSVADGSEKDGSVQPGTTASSLPSLRAGGIVSF